MSKALEEYLAHRETVRRWLIAVVPDLADVLVEDAEVDWLRTLSDGVALCLLMKKVRPDLVPDIEHTEAPMFLLWANITIFLEAIQAMGLSTKAVGFKEGDLYYKKNLVKVVHTLLELGCVCAERKMAVPSLPEIYVSVFKEGADAIANCAPVPEEQLSGVDLSAYSFPAVLKRLTTWQGTGGAPKSPRKAFRSSCHRGAAEESKGPEPEEVDSLVRLQAFFRMIPARRSLKKRLKAEAYRARVAGEILQTEQLYVDNLNVLVQSFLLPLRTNQDALMVHHIYAEVEVILAFSTLLLEDLKPIMAAWDHRSCIGDIFLKTCAYMKVYTQYVKDYSLFVGALIKAQKRSKFQAAMEQCIADCEGKAQPFESYLIMPVQRIPRYEMLLKDLHKNTGVDHPDYEKLGSAYQQIKEVALYVNEQKRDFENLMRVSEIEKSITEDISLCEPHRRVVKELELLGLPQEEARKIILFNDVLVVGKPKGKKLSSARKFGLTSFTMNPLADTETAEGNFQLHLEDNSTLAFSLSTGAARDEFLDLLGKQQQAWKSATESLAEAEDEEEEEEEEEAGSGVSFSKDTDGEKKRRKRSKDPKAEARRKLMRGISTKIEPGANAREVLKIFSDANNSLGVEEQFSVEAALKRSKKEREKQKRLTKVLDKQFKTTSKRASGKVPGTTPPSTSGGSSGSKKKKYATGTIGAKLRKHGLKSSRGKQGSFTTDDVSKIAQQYGPQIDLSELRDKLTANKASKKARPANPFMPASDPAPVGKAVRKPPPAPARRSLAASSGPVAEYSAVQESRDKVSSTPTAPKLSSSQRNRGRHRSKVLAGNNDEIVQAAPAITAEASTRKVPPPRPERPDRKKRGLRNTMVR
eukprot:CAMPEP_0114607680 /NCGR_PEP_ID=MMETSP0168-20121206/2190_1 /TAXON_ID=95228 ORGANISM="Vannella sp., Strain DIVA3 517/6/12" /NCGR_SAMPLE_ID=MMETSP0168 /ASSEMBLY_ACC=CAM_ASM_000044 /LENGTH=865 /DNA_ID=CAMNT_0001818559 /DNA_START=41 /DNA_END=2635 /DNA_ORIENTATION=+